MAKIVFIVWALLLYVGALMGSKAGSKVSLIMGLISGTLVLVGVYLIAAQGRSGYLFLAGINALLTATFLQRLLKTKKFMPSGMLLVLSLAMFVFTLLQCNG